MSIDRVKLLSIIQPWIGTPFRDDLAVRGMGTDCKLFCAAVFSEYLGQAMPDPKLFQAKSRYDDREVIPLLQAVFGSLFKLASKPVEVGDWIGFRFYGDGHSAIALGDGEIAHCSRKYGVCIERLSPEQWDRLICVFRMVPGGVA